MVVVDVFEPVKGRDFNLGAFSPRDNSNKDKFKFEDISIDSPKVNTGVSSSKKKSGGSNSSPIAKAENIKAGLNIAKAAFEIKGAIDEFEGIESRARFNIDLANRQFSEALSSGKRDALRESSKGFAKGEQALLSAVAQGQRAGGGVATSLQKAEETIGILNAALIETNAIRQAYGFKSKASLIQHDLDIAEINRDNQIAGSVLSGLISASAFI